MRGRRIDEHPALWDAAQRRVIAQCAGCEVAQLGQRLDAGITGADEDEPELPFLLRSVDGNSGGFEAAENVVA